MLNKHNKSRKSETMEVEKMLVFGGEDKDVMEQLQTRQKSKYAKDFT